MKLQGETVISAPRDIVWTALNDETLLVACIPGCEALERVTETELAAALTVKLGPVKAKFKGDVKLDNIDAPHSYRLVGEGKGAAGFARGHADVVLVELDGGNETRLNWSAEASVGGKLAQMGARLIDSTAKKYADDFFGKFNALTLERAEMAVTAKTGAASDDAAPSEAESISQAAGTEKGADRVPAGVEDDVAVAGTEKWPADKEEKRRALPPYIWVTVFTLVILGLLYGLAG